MRLYPPQGSPAPGNFRPYGPSPFGRSRSTTQRNIINPPAVMQELPRELLPFSDLITSELVDVTQSDAVVGNDYRRMGSGLDPQYADSNFNVIRAAILRKSRVEAQKGVQLKGLDGLLNLPLEIIFSILEYLHPIDFYRLSLASPDFQNLLENQTLLLMGVYQSHGVPLWPPEISYAKWSALLFGDAICDRCRKFVALPDFVHRQRICSICYRDGFGPGRDWDQVVKMVPMGARHDGWRLMKPNPPIQRSYGIRDKAQMRKMHDVLASLKSSGKSTQEIDEFIEEKRVQVEAIAMHAYDCDLWMYNLFFGLNEDMKSTRQASVDRLKAVLIAQGCQDTDFVRWDRELISRWCSRVQPDHKRKSWIATLKTLKAIAVQSRNQRLQEEGLKLRQQRSQLISLAYTKYMVTSAQSRPLWSHPPVEVFLASTPCEAIMKGPARVPHEPKERKYAAWIRALFTDEIVEKWSRVKKVDLERCIVIPKGLTFGTAGLGVEQGKMGLVISTFTCPMCRDHVRRTSCLACQKRAGDGAGGRGHGHGGKHSCSATQSQTSTPDKTTTVDKFDNPTGVVLFGWEEVKEHFVCVKGPAKNTTKGVSTGGGPVTASTGALMFNKRASELMLIIVKKLGLDPCMATAGDLDQLGKGFLCYESIGVHPGSSLAKTKVFNWRDFVIHVLRHGQRDRFHISWSLNTLLVRVVNIGSGTS
ncbi:hypothetical protein BDN72DRAFT_965035 [Pluteus cervinus]|uniref:Uncharacterized protein n=1 Tax=Pluteus cervinus TaxID=181527 RepID=A0ACD3A7W7_9AGAR|nr:hypothetical protein BDN72DRAFT_965035 [Pluteus cervinus]